MIEEGHEIGNHTQEHKRLTEISDEEIREQLGIVHERVKEMTGYDIKIFRPPGGVITKPYVRLQICHPSSGAWTQEIGSI